MIKWLITAALLFPFCWSGTLSAQDVAYSPYEKFEMRNGDFSVIGKLNNRLYTYRSGNEGHFLDIFDDSMNRLATVILDFFPEKINETRFIAGSDRIVVLYQAQEGGKVHQYIAVLDDQGRLSGRPVSVAQTKMGLFGQNRNYFSSVVSDDKKTAVIYNVEVKGERLSFSGIWIDDHANILKRSQAEYKADNNIASGDALLGNDGSIYLPAYTPVGSRDYADQLWLLVLGQGERTFRSAEFSLDNHFAAGAYIKMDPVNDRVYIGGFYSDKKAGNYDGVLFGYYDIPGAEIRKPRLIAFDDRLRHAAGGKNTKKAFNSYVVRNLIVKNDGGFVMIAESYFLSSRNTGYTPGWGYYSMYSYGPFMSPAIREYYYGDIMALSYNAEGTREWQSFIRKDQYSQEDGGFFSSFAFLNTGGTLGFLFNDYNTSKSRIQLASIDGTGKIAMRSMAAGGNEDPDWTPRAGKQVAAREIVVPCFRKRQICFAKIVF